MNMNFVPENESSLPNVLKLDKTGVPVAWLHWKEATILYWNDKVVWSLGEDQPIILRGGRDLEGNQHVFELPPIIACEDFTIQRRKRKVPNLSREALIRRDRNLCMYCGWAFKSKVLTIDHVIPTGKGGRHTWENTVAACKKCNHKKGCKTPEEAGMPLLAVPYAPCQAEYIALKGRKVIACQMDYLTKMIPEESRYHSS